MRKRHTYASKVGYAPFYLSPLLLGVLLFQMGRISAKIHDIKEDTQQRWGKTFQLTQDILELGQQISIENEKNKREFEKKRHPSPQ